MLIGLLLIIMEIIVILFIVHLDSIGGSKYFVFERDPGYALMVLFLAHIWCVKYSSKDAIWAVNAYNTYQNELEKELTEKYNPPTHNE